MHMSTIISWQTSVCVCVCVFMHCTSPKSQPGGQIRLVSKTKTSTHTHNASQFPYLQPIVSFGAHTIQAEIGNQSSSPFARRFNLVPLRIYIYIYLYFIFSLIYIHIHRFINLQIWTITSTTAAPITSCWINWTLAV